MPTKNYVLDTNVLVNDPNCIFSFSDNNLFIPIQVLEELDSFKSEQSQRGHSARQAIRFLDDLRSEGSLSNGVPTPEGGTLTIISNHLHAPQLLPSPDSFILGAAIHIKNNSPLKTILVTMDINLRVRAESLNVQTAPYFNAQVKSFNNDIIEVNDLPDSIIDAIFSTGSIPIIDELLDAQPNSSVILRSVSKKSALAVRKNDKLISVKPQMDFLGIKPRNKEQSFAMSLLDDDSINLVSLMGIAGSGKSLLAICVGLSKVVTGQYDKLTVARPTVPMGNDIGFLPGSMEEKLAPWMRPIHDALDLIAHSAGRKLPKIDDLFRQQKIVIEPLSFIRGRSLHNQFFVLDECFPYHTPISTEIGKREIGSLFTDWINDKPIPLVKSFDETSKTFVYKKVSNMAYKGKREIVIVCAANREIKCTPDHPFLTYNRGWVQAQRLSNTDLLVADHPEELQIAAPLSDDQKQIVYGSFLGDGSISSISSRIYRMKIVHGLPQSEYCKWKAEMFHCTTSLAKNCGFNKDEDKICFSTRSFGLDASFVKPKINCPQEILDRLNEKGLAIWFMDDGSASKHNQATLHTESFDTDSVNRMISMLESKFNLKSMLMVSKGRNIIRFNKENYLKLCSIISPFIHPNISYKIHPDFVSEVFDWSVSSTVPEFGLVCVKDVIFTGTFDHVFDMEVQDTHNFLVPSVSRGRLAGDGGIVVHNCQNTSAKEIKTIISRVGQNSKIVLTGDPDQIDTPYLDKLSNGLSYTTSKLSHPIVAHLKLVKGERSLLSSLAATYL